MSKGKDTQKSKEDWWLCNCGSYHKGFPYKCPVKEAKKEIIQWSEDWFDNKRKNNDMWRMNQNELTDLFIEELKQQKHKEVK